MENNEIKNRNIELSEYPNKNNMIKVQNKLAEVQVDLNSQQKHTYEAKVEEGVNEYGSTTCLKVPKLHVPSPPRHLKQQPRS